MDDLEKLADTMKLAIETSDTWARVSLHTTRARQIEAALRASAAREKALREALAAVDAADGACPIGKGLQRATERCKLCGATSDQNCGPVVTAESNVVRVARAALEGAPHD